MSRIELHGKQREVLALPAYGHTIVLGTAGSGKTTIALMRAKYLAELPGDARVLLVTFNRALSNHMSNLCGSIPDCLTIETYHTFARGYLASRGKMSGYGKIITSSEKESHIKSARDFYREKFPDESTLKRPVRFFVDEIAFIQKFGFSNFAEYHAARRIGRAAANLRRKNREWIYRVYERYLELRTSLGHMYDWDDLAKHVHDELMDDDGQRMYSHIIIDEGQDYSPMMIKSLVAAVAKEGSLTFFGDVAQQVYGTCLSWRDSGIDCEKIWHFEANYRNPTTIVAFAEDITAYGHWISDEDMVAPVAQAAEGPKPILTSFSCRKKEIEWVVQQAIMSSKTSSVVVVCRNRTLTSEVADLVRHSGYGAIEIERNTASAFREGVVHVTTFHTAKGLEFDNVFIPFLSEGMFPDEGKFETTLPLEEIYADEIKLFYVGVTRSKYGLFMSYHDNLSVLFPEDSKNYDRYTEEDL